jgi:hypothetical protein
MDPDMTTFPQPDGATDGESAATPSVLDRRRQKMQATRTAAQDAGAAVDELDTRLDTNSSETREHEAALHTALDRVAALKKAIKAAGKQNSRLASSRKDARRAAARAQQRAAGAEARYDRAVLADMLRREKDRDLSVHGAQPTAPAGGNPSSDTPARATTPRRSSGTARATAARATAARATAARARSSSLHGTG